MTEIITFGDPKDNPVQGKNYTPPVLDERAFHCPHCKTYAHQIWAIIGCAVRRTPSDILAAHFQQVFINQRDLEGVIKTSLCGYCRHICLWCNEKIVYPDVSIAPPPNDDLPKKALENYREASSVFFRSHRAAAALLRLAMEEIFNHVECKGNTLQEKIDYLIEHHKIPKEIAEAMDIVRIIGNEAVHPGTIDLQEKPETVTALFNLVNLVAERLITGPREIKKLHESLPDSKKRKNMPPK